MLQNIPTLQTPQAIPGIVKLQHPIARAQRRATLRHPTAAEVTPAILQHLIHTKQVQVRQQDRQMQFSPA